MMGRLFFVAGLSMLVLGGCSASASDPPRAGSHPPQAAQSARPRPATPAPVASPAEPVAGYQAGMQDGQLTGTPTRPVSGTVPPTLAPVGPIPGPELAGENPATTIQNPYAGNPSALEQGREYFVQMNCAGCHGGHAGGGMGPDLRPDHIFKFGNTPADLFDSISQGRGMGMPSWGTKLPPDVIWKLVTYIESLGTPQEPSKAAAAPVSAPDSIASPTY